MLDRALEVSETNNFRYIYVYIYICIHILTCVCSIYNIYIYIYVYVCTCIHMDISVLTNNVALAKQTSLPESTNALSDCSQARHTGKHQWILTYHHLGMIYDI